MRRKSSPFFSPSVFRRRSHVWAGSLGPRVHMQNATFIRAAAAAAVICRFEFSKRTVECRQPLCAYESSDDDGVHLVASDDLHIGLRERQTSRITTLL